MEIEFKKASEVEGPLVHMTARMFEFVMAEFTRIHELMDRLDIPRDSDGAKFSASQRVEIYTTAMEKILATLSQPTNHTAH